MGKRCLSEVVTHQDRRHITLTEYLCVCVCPSAFNKELGKVAQLVSYSAVRSYIINKDKS